MAKGLLFWILMILLLVAALIRWLPGPASQSPGLSLAGAVVLWALLFLLGWAVFGFVVQ